MELNVVEKKVITTFSGTIGPLNKVIELQFNVPTFTGEQIVQWVKNGEVIYETDISCNEVVQHDLAVGIGDWVRIQLRNKEGQFLACTNPYFIRGKGGF
ncbi:hypothetical protein [Alkalihalobacillus sp. BA299]|uniref:hypothetical protein n=1 Tax=Alkalihalobacillus sp. BA299 TaxID=2815938 RepID=UPI001ADA84E7|nr:hypothetical protein [Alkalihalobacillus sp. BA299]